jgi:hypothetical protein
MAEKAERLGWTYTAMQSRRLVTVWLKRPATNGRLSSLGTGPENRHDSYPMLWEEMAITSTNCPARAVKDQSERTLPAGNIY